MNIFLRFVSMDFHTLACITVNQSLVLNFYAHHARFKVPMVLLMMLVGLNLVVFYHTEQVLFLDYKGVGLLTFNFQEADVLH